MPSTRTKLLLALSAVLLVAVYATAVLLSTTDDRVDQIDTKDLKRVARSACITLRADLDALPLLPSGASSAERSARVDEQAVIVNRFLDTVRAVGDDVLDDDRPAREWLGDWQSLLQVRQGLAAGGFTGAFEVPRDGADPITRRMDDIGIDACRVPTGLTTAP